MALKRLKSYNCSIQPVKLLKQDFDTLLEISFPHTQRTDCLSSGLLLLSFIINKNIFYKAIFNQAYGGKL